MEEHPGTPLMTAVTSFQAILSLNSREQFPFLSADNNMEAMWLLMFSILSYECEVLFL